MSENYEKIKIDEIVPNDKNNRENDSWELAILAESIKDVGMIEPIVVYKDDSTDKYVILSGHRRYAAAKQLGMDELACKVVPKPGDDYEEQEYLAQANIHRSSPEALKNEIDLMNREWQTMDTDRRNTLRERLLEEFQTSNADNPRYTDDPDGFTLRNFRPRYAYISRMTGLGISNATVKNYLQQIKREDDEENEADVDIATADDVGSESSSGKKPVTLKSLAKAAKSLIDKMDDITIEDGEIVQAVEASHQALQEMIDVITERSDPHYNDESAYDRALDEAGL